MSSGSLSRDLWCFSTSSCGRQGEGRVNGASRRRQGRRRRRRRAGALHGPPGTLHGDCSARWCVWAHWRASRAPPELQAPKWAGPRALRRCKHSCLAGHPTARTSMSLGSSGESRRGGARPPRFAERGLAIAACSVKTPLTCNSLGALPPAQGASMHCMGSQRRRGSLNSAQALCRQLLFAAIQCWAAAAHLPPSPAATRLHVHGVASLRLERRGGDRSISS